MTLLIRPKIYAIYGFVASGKTCLAKKLEQDGLGISLSQDTWMLELFGANPSSSEFEIMFNKIWSLILQTSQSVLKLNQSVIYDRGFWTRKSRDDLRSFAMRSNAQLIFIKLDVSLAILLSRVRERISTGNYTGSFAIDTAAFELFLMRFEPLAEDEPHITLDSSSISKLLTVDYRSSFDIECNPLAVST